jgi:predicted phosphodiesterase
LRPDVIIFGHSHLPDLKKKENTLLFNPGSLSGNLTLLSANYGVLNIEGNDIGGEIFKLNRCNYYNEILPLTLTLSPEGRGKRPTNRSTD